MLSQVVINQGNFDLQNRAENVVQTVVHCFSITSTNKLIINKIIPLSQSPLGSSGSSRIEIAPKGDRWRVKGSSPLFFRAFSSVGQSSRLII